MFKNLLSAVILIQSITNISSDLQSENVTSSTDKAELTTVESLTRPIRLPIKYVYTIRVPITTTTSLPLLRNFIDPPIITNRQDSFHSDDYDDQPPAEPSRHITHYIIRDRLPERGYVRESKKPNGYEREVYEEIHEPNELSNSYNKKYEYESSYASKYPNENESSNDRSVYSETIESPTETPTEPPPPVYISHYKLPSSSYEIHAHDEDDERENKKSEKSKSSKYKLSNYEPHDHVDHDDDWDSPKVSHKGWVYSMIGGYNAWGPSTKRRSPHAMESVLSFAGLPFMPQMGMHAAGGHPYYHHQQYIEPMHYPMQQSFYQPVQQVQMHQPPPQLHQPTFPAPRKVPLDRSPSVPEPASVKTKYPCGHDHVISESKPEGKKGEEKEKKKGADWYKDSGHKKHGWKNVFHKEEWGDNKKYHDIWHDKDWKKKWKKWKHEDEKEGAKKWKGHDGEEKHYNEEHDKHYDKKGKGGSKHSKALQFHKGDIYDKKKWHAKKGGGNVKKGRKEQKKKDSAEDHEGMYEKGDGYEESYQPPEHDGGHDEKYEEHDEESHSGSRLLPITVFRQLCKQDCSPPDY